jgi:Uma2 family endonuclease
MPTVITLDDLAAMAMADEHHRYELSRERVLSILPPATPDSETIDRVIKRDEYASAGVPRYWIVEADKGNTVHMLRLDEAGYAPERATMSLDWLLNEAVPDLT